MPSGDLAAPAGGRDQCPDTVRLCLSGAGWGLIEEAPGQGQGRTMTANHVAQDTRVHVELKRMGCKIEANSDRRLQVKDRISADREMELAPSSRLAKFTKIGIRMNKLLGAKSDLVTAVALS